MPAVGRQPASFAAMEAAAIPAVHAVLLRVTADSDSQHLRSGHQPSGTGRPPPGPRPWLGPERRRSQSGPVSLRRSRAVPVLFPWSRAVRVRSGHRGWDGCGAWDRVSPTSDVAGRCSSHIRSPVVAPPCRGRPWPVGVRPAVQVSGQRSRSGVARHGARSRRRCWRARWQRRPG